MLHFSGTDRFLVEPGHRFFDTGDSLGAGGLGFGTADRTLIKITEARA